jgi:hypothetical protein
MKKGCLCKGTLFFSESLVSKKHRNKVNSNLNTLVMLMSNSHIYN